MPVSQVAQYMPPQARQISDTDGNVSDNWFSFFSNIGFAQGANIPQLAAGATLAQTVATLNLVIAALVAQKRLASS